MSKDTVQVHIGEGVDDVAGRFLDGWNRMARGEDVNEKHVSFATWETFVSVMTRKRLQQPLPVGDEETAIQREFISL